MSNIDIRGQLDPLLRQLTLEKSLDAAEKLAAKLAGLLGVSVDDRYLLNIPRIDAELSRFELAPGFARQAAAFELPNDHENTFDLKLFWIKKATKTNLSWLVGLTPNFEDSEANDYKNIGIDFVVPETADSLIILLSNKYKIRSLELKGHITQTQLEIFSIWLSVLHENLEPSKESKHLIHSKLWESFNFEPINRKFYEELVESFSLLVLHLEKEFGRKPSVMFTTRLIGRILFCWFLRKKNLINQNFDYFSAGDPHLQSNYYKEKLEILFFETLNKEPTDRTHGDSITPYLNGGLFDIAITDFHGNTKLTFPNGFFNRLYETLNKYNFTIDESSPEFQQVAIDPEMLGRIFESLLAEQIDENTGDNKKKSTGAFYTPREVVAFMCEQAVIEFLRNKLPETTDRDRRIEELVRLPETIFRDQDQNKRRDWKPYAEQIIKALDGGGVNPMTVLDPAVGSGAFPMGMLNLLTKIYGRLDSKYEKNVSQLKRTILSKSIYGVDIEQTAIEICRLRAWLSIIVDVSESEKIDPLPNLDFKFACANTLIPLDSDHQAALFDDPELKNKLMNIRDDYFVTSNKSRKNKLQEEYEKLTHQEGMFDSRRTKQLKSYKPFDLSMGSDFYDPEIHHGVSSFDIVIGNPPYVSTKGVDAKMKTILDEIYGFSDDLYSHFYFRSFEFLKDKGLLAFITSKTFWTIQTKKNVRELLLSNNILFLYDTSNPFDNAMVDTCVVLVSKEETQDRAIDFLILDGDYSSPVRFKAEKLIYENAVNNVIFQPTEKNLKVYQKLNPIVKSLVDEWWLAINSSKNITKYQDAIVTHQKSLKPGMLTLLGLVTDGGQGLATANNGRFIGVVSSSKEAEKILKSRPIKFVDFVLKENLKEFGSSKEELVKYFSSLTEIQIQNLFDSMKEKYGRDIFGQGYLYKILTEDDIRLVDTLSELEKIQGIESGPKFVAYDKGDKDGNRWFLQSPFFIDWSCKSVSFLKDNSGKKGEGMPVLRNPQFYFRRGVCWILTLNEQSEYQKARIKEAGVFDVNAMSLFPSIDLINEKFIVCLLNSYLIFQFKRNFINGSSAFQINDARQIPVVIPSAQQLSQFESIFDKAYSIKSKQYLGALSDKEANSKLDLIQSELDAKVLELYQL